MGKRSSEQQISKEEYDSDEAGGEEQAGSFKKASAEQLKKRRIVKSTFKPSPTPPSGVSGGGLFSGVLLSSRSDPTTSAASRPNPLAPPQAQLVDPSASSVYYQHAQNLNDAFVSHIIKLSQESPSSDWTPAVKSYSRYSTAINAEYSQNQRASSSRNESLTNAAPAAPPNGSLFSPAAATTAAASAPTFTFVSSTTTAPAAPSPAQPFAATAAAATASNTVPPPREEDDTPEEADDEPSSFGKSDDSDFETRFEVAKSLLHKFRTVTDEKGNPVKDESGKSRKAFEKLDGMFSLRVEQSKTTGNYIIVMRDSLGLPKFSLAIMKDMEFTVRANKTKTGKTAHKVQFLGIVDPDQTKPADEKEVELCQIQVGELHLEDFLQNLQLAGAKVNR